jgi:hypothetical protein
MTEQEHIELQAKYEARIQELENDKIAAAAQAEEQKIASATHDAVKAIDHKPAAAPSVGLQAMRRQQAVAACGGNALWHSLPVETRMKSLGYSQALSEADVKLSQELFGKNSSSLAASRLSRQNPNRYAYLRAVHREII